MSTVEISTPHSTHQVDEGKLTSLGLYVTAREAYEMWQADPEQIKVLDVRTFEEYVLIGHAEMAANVPLAFPSYKWDANKGNYSIAINTDFIAHTKERFKRMIPSWPCAALAAAVLWQSMRWPRPVLPKSTISSMVLKAIRWTTLKASIMANESGMAGRTPFPGLADLTPHWSGCRLKASWKSSAKPSICDLDQGHLYKFSRINPNGLMRH